MLPREVEVNPRERYSVLKGAYERRLESLGAEIERLYSLVKSEAVSSVLQDDNKSSSFGTSSPTGLRTRELIRDGLYKEQEEFISSLASALADAEVRTRFCVYTPQRIPRTLFEKYLHHPAPSQLRTPPNFGTVPGC